MSKTPSRWHGSLTPKQPTLKPTYIPHGTKSISNQQHSYSLPLHCSYDYIAIVVALIYLYLLVRCVSLMRDHHTSWSNRQANGLIWYLGCTVLLCLCRCLQFALLPTIGQPCDTTYRPLAWETTGLSYHTLSSQPQLNSYFTTLSLLSIIALPLFLSSYTYFFHSLSKVLMMLLDASNSETSGGHAYIILLSAFNITIWTSSISLSSSLLFTRMEQYSAFIYPLARNAIAIAVASTGIGFGVLFTKALIFLYKSHRENGSSSSYTGKSSQLVRLLGLKRVRGVCATCTIIFYLRAAVVFYSGKGLQLGHLASASLWVEFSYFILLECLPTLYMISAFKPSSLADAAIGSRRAATTEYDILKATLTSNIAVVSSPARTGFTSRYYATPEKYRYGGSVGGGYGGYGGYHDDCSSVQSMQDCEERSQLLHTPGSEAGSVVTGLDALELERGDIYRL